MTRELKMMRKKLQKVINNKYVTFRCINLTNDAPTQEFDPLFASDSDPACVTASENTVFKCIPLSGSAACLFIPPGLVFSSILPTCRSVTGQELRRE